MAIYATDEDVAIRVPTDFSNLCPSDQIVAAGSDGAFTAEAPWILHSASQSFLASGVKPGHLVRLRRPESIYPPPGELLAIHQVSEHSIELRRKGFGVRQGQAPAPQSGLAGVEFVILSFQPQLELASADLDDRFGIDASKPGRRPEEVLDMASLRDLTVLLTLLRRYRELGTNPADVNNAMTFKANRLQEEFDQRLSRAFHRRTMVPTASGTGLAGRMSTRLGR
jgi:hypothetical protein